MSPMPRPVGRITALDPPAGTPSWLPTVDDERSLRRLRIAIWIVLCLGLAAHVVEGANRPPDPTLGPPAAPAPDPAAADSQARRPLPGFGEVAARITGPDGDEALGCLLEARTPQQRQRGLMGVTDLGGYAGMAFVFEEDTSSPFWMRNTPMPLTIAWIDAGGVVLGTTDMVPCEDRDDCPLYDPPGAYRKAVEVPRGAHSALGLVPGATVVLGGACPLP